MCGHVVGDDSLQIRRPEKFSSVQKLLFYLYQDFRAAWGRNKKIFINEFNIHIIEIKIGT